MEIFIAGSSRSGTTLLGRLLDRHPKISTLPELHFFEQIWDPTTDGPKGREELRDLIARLFAVARDGYLNSPSPQKYQRQANDLLRQWPDRDPTPTEAYVAFLRFEAAEVGCDIPCEHTPRNIFFLPQLLSLSDNSRVIVMIRDPRDVVLSQRHKWRRSRLSNRTIPRREAVRALLAYHPANVAFLWSASIKTLSQLGQSDRVYLLRYEDLIANPATVTESLCDFLAITWTSELLQVDSRGSSVASDLERKPGFDPTRVSAWRRAKGPGELADIAICQAVCRRPMEDLGYVRAHIDVPLTYLALQIISWPFRTLCGAVVNLHRVQSPWAAFRARFAGPRARQVD